MGTQKTGMLIRMWTVRLFVRFQVETRTLLGIRLEACMVLLSAKELVLILYFVHALRFCRRLSLLRTK
jgi:hypothetical protein